MYFYKDFILHEGNKCPSMSILDFGYKLLEKISNKNIKNGPINIEDLSSVGLLQ